MNFRIVTLLIACVPVAFLVAGCSSDDEELRTFSEEDNVENTDPPDVHQHASHGPHGGHLAELGGDDYHAEIVFDADARELTVYLLGSDVETPLPVSSETLNLNLTLGDGPTVVELASAPLEGEADGSSRFSVAGEAVPEGIQDEEDLNGSVVLTIDGTPYRGDIMHDHEHDHAHD